MPHSSGGGSHGGGSHGGSHGSSSPSGVRKNYYAGSKRYVYYVNHKPEYIYSNYDPTKPNWKMLITSIVLVLFFSTFSFVGFALSLFESTNPISDSYSQKGVVIEDRANVFTDTTNLESELTTFYEKTNISPTIITVNNEEWSSHYTSLEKYAYELYVTRYKDESHWVIVYSEPHDPDEDFNDWYFEGMQGDDTDPLLTDSITSNFNKVAYTYLLQTDDYSTEDAFAHAFHDAINEKVMKKPNIIQSLTLLAVGLITTVIFIGLASVSAFPKKKYKTAMEVPLTVTEESCDYCSGIYVVGQYTTCPHCGAPVKPHTYEIDQDGNKKVIE